MWLILSSRKAGFISGLFVCPGLEDSWQPPIYLWWTSISLCKAGRQQEEQLTSSAGSGQGWAIVMNIMCKYERRETKGWFCYGNVVIGADWVLIWCVCVCACVHTCKCMCMSSCMHAGNKIVWFLLLSTQLSNIIASLLLIRSASGEQNCILITSHQLIGYCTSFNHYDKNHHLQHRNMAVIASSF